MIDLSNVEGHKVSFVAVEIPAHYTDGGYTHVPARNGEAFSCTCGTSNADSVSKGVLGGGVKADAAEHLVSALKRAALVYGAEIKF